MKFPGGLVVRITWTMSLLLYPKYISYFFSLNKEKRTLKIGGRDFPGGPVAKALHSQCRGPGFNPWSGKLDPTCHLSEFSCRSWKVSCASTTTQHSQINKYLSLIGERPTVENTTLPSAETQQCAKMGSDWASPSPFIVFSCHHLCWPQATDQGPICSSRYKKVPFLSQNHLERALPTSTPHYPKTKCHSLWQWRLVCPTVTFASVLHFCFWGRRLFSAIKNRDFNN